jgi:hypothetical protein
MKYAFLISVLAVLGIAVTAITLYGVKLNNEQYDRLKSIVINWSAITALLGVIVATFNVSYGAETITVVAAIGVFLARCLNVSIANFNDGAAIHPDEAPLADDWGEAIEGGDED